jgi:hypothetical protein
VTEVAGCEALAVRDIRACLLGPAGLSRDRVVTRGYWRAGEANHPDHDFGQDPVQPCSPRRAHTRALVSPLSRHHCSYPDRNGYPAHL